MKTRDNFAISIGTKAFINVVSKVSDNLKELPSHVLVFNYSKQANPKIN